MDLQSREGLDVYKSLYIANNPSQQKRHAGVGRAVYHTSEYIRHRTYIPMGYLKEYARLGTFVTNAYLYAVGSSMKDFVAKWQATAKVFFFLTNNPTAECCHSLRLASYRGLGIVTHPHKNFKGRTYGVHGDPSTRYQPGLRMQEWGIHSTVHLFPSFNGLYVCL